MNSQLRNSEDSSSLSNSLRSSKFVASQRNLLAKKQNKNHSKFDLQILNVLFVSNQVHLQCRLLQGEKLPSNNVWLVTVDVGRKLKCTAMLRVQKCALVFFKDNWEAVNNDANGFRRMTSELRLKELAGLWFKLHLCVYDFAPFSFSIESKYQESRYKATL